MDSLVFAMDNNILNKQENNTNQPCNSDLNNTITHNNNNNNIQSHNNKDSECNVKPLDSNENQIKTALNSNISNSLNNSINNTLDSTDNSLTSKSNLLKLVDPNPIIRNDNLNDTMIKDINTNNVSNSNLHNTNTTNLSKDTNNTGLNKRNLSSISMNNNTLPSNITTPSNTTLNSQSTQLRIFQRLDDLSTRLISMEEVLLKISKKQDQNEKLLNNLNNIVSNHENTANGNMRNEKNDKLLWDLLHSVSTISKNYLNSNSQIINNEYSNLQNIASSNNNINNGTANFNMDNNNTNLINNNPESSFAQIPISFKSFNNNKSNNLNDTFILNPNGIKKRKRAGNNLLSSTTNPNSLLTFHSNNSNNNNKSNNFLSKPLKGISFNNGGNSAASKNIPNTNSNDNFVNTNTNTLVDLVNLPQNIAKDLKNDSIAAAHSNNISNGADNSTTTDNINLDSNNNNNSTTNNNSGNNNINDNTSNNSCTTGRRRSSDLMDEDGYQEDDEDGDDNINNLPNSINPHGVVDDDDKVISDDVEEYEEEDDEHIVFSSNNTTVNTNNNNADIEGEDDESLEGEEEDEVDEDKIQIDGTRNARNFLKRSNSKTKLKSKLKKISMFNMRKIASSSDISTNPVPSSISLPSQIKTSLDSIGGNTNSLSNFPHGPDDTNSMKLKPIKMIEDKDTDIPKIGSGNRSNNFCDHRKTSVDRGANLNDEEGGDTDELNKLNYKISKAPNNVKTIWDEYVYGINGNPSIRGLEEKYGNKWRLTKNRKTFSRRKRLYKFILNGIDKGKTADEMIRLLEEKRLYKDENGEVKRRTIGWLQQSLTGI